MKEIELLAPAKDLECGIGAIVLGADAVYIGAPQFGARSSAGNSLNDINKLINFAHKYYAKIYITINTILMDEELSEARKLIEEIYELGADGIIIQDMGILEMDLPPIPLIASTQAHNISVEKIKFFEQVGLKRVILARELSIEQIKEISEQVNIELEAFLHGALCVSYSGQCYMSQAIGGRSGNRGQCAQPCRKPYSLKDSAGPLIAEKQYLLSLKDMNRSIYIEEMIKAGISSFKIEGRLKDLAYIKNVVSYYRKEIDVILEKLNMKKASSGKPFTDFEPDLYKTFNRGYTGYFINGRKKDILSPFTPKSIGEKIGAVQEVKKNYFILEKNIVLDPGDGICFFNEKKQLEGTIINKIINNKIFPKEIDNINKNTLIYRNHPVKFLKQLKNAKIKRLIDVKFLLTETSNQIILSACDEDNNNAVVAFNAPGEQAQDKDKLIFNYNKQLSKLGETDFNISNLSLNLSHYYYIPVKDINEIRRKVIEQLLAIREMNRKKDTCRIVHNDYPYPVKELDFRANIYNDLAKKFYQRHGVKKLEPAAESLADMSGKIVMTTKHCLKYQFNLCSKYNTNVNVKEPLFLIDDQNKTYKLNFNCKKCEMEIIY
ncbi:MAG: U32 family peptidase [Cyanobacteriota bacterium]